MNEQVELPKRRPGRPRKYDEPGIVYRKRTGSIVKQSSISVRLKINPEFAILLENADVYGIPYGYYMQIIFLKYVENVPYWDSNEKLIYHPTTIVPVPKPLIIDIGLHWTLYDELKNRVTALDTTRSFIMQDAMRQYIENGAWDADEAAYMQTNIYEMIYKVADPHKLTAIRSNVPTDTFLKLTTLATRAEQAIGKYVSDVLVNHVLQQEGYELVKHQTRRQRQQSKLQSYLDSQGHLPN